MEVDDSYESDEGEHGDNQEEGVKDEKLECDLTAYVLFHEGSTGAPCLSFDIVKDDLGDNRDCEVPVTCYFVSGSQAAQTHLNNIVLLKMSNLKKVNMPEDSDEDSDDDDEEENKPVIASALVKHNGCVNRIRATRIDNVPFAASWSELGQVNIWDMSSMVEAVNSQNPYPLNLNPLYTFSGHCVEGFALDWAPTMPGTLATGDCSKYIYVWKPEEGGRWAVDNRPFTGHTDSVEDIQWSPNEPNVFASCSVDKSIRIWDARVNPNKACMLTCDNAHESDVNVIHWNKNEPFIASGGDDGRVRIWDLRKFETKTSVALLQYHNGPVCTVEWHPSDASVLSSGGEDNQVLQWDLAVEKDTQGEEKDDTPEQLLFVHEGQKEVKEIHWHPQIPGLMISTAHSGFNIFKTISC